VPASTALIVVVVSGEEGLEVQTGGRVSGVRRVLMGIKN